MDLEQKLFDNGLEYNKINCDGKIVTIQITKTENFKIYSYIRKLNRLFKINIRRNQHSVDKDNYYVYIKKDRLK